MREPLLAAKMPRGKTVEELVTKLIYPLYVSPKLDGIRLLHKDSSIMTRKFKPLPNAHVRKILSREEYTGLDGECLVTPPDDPKAFRKAQSALMSHEGKPDFTFYVFDLWPLDEGFSRRYKSLKKRAASLDHVELVPQILVESAEELLQAEAQFLDEGYEGAIVRSIDGEYKWGRSTWREGIMRKLVRTTRDEAIIIGYEEQMHNGNEAVRDARGKLKRSSHKENMSGKGVLGAVICKSAKFPEPFSVGTGFDDDEREELWKNPEKLIGQKITFEHRPYGNYDSPRFAVYVGPRKDI